MYYFINYICIKKSYNYNINAETNTNGYYICDSMATNGSGQDSKMSSMTSLSLI